MTAQAPDPLDPLGYPWAEPLVTDPQSAQARAGELVVAVGSNGSPSVVRAKLTAAGAGGVVAFIACRLRGVRVGHSAHVSVRGYVAATPVAEPGGDGVDLVASWFDPLQLAALDATEPNYDRIWLPSSGSGLTLADGTHPDGCWVYDSRWGALADEGRPLDLRPQRRLHDWLLSDPVLARWLAPGTTSAIMTALGDAGLRTRIREQWAGSGRAVPSGLRAGRRAEGAQGRTRARAVKAERGSPHG